MFEKELIQEAGLTEGEAKVYMALLEIGSSSIGPIIRKSGVARSFAYNILESLIKKGLASHVTRGKRRLFQAAEPSRILDHLEKKASELELSMQALKSILPGLEEVRKERPRTSISVFEGYRGILTATEHYSQKLRAGDEYLVFGGYPIRKDRYDVYWRKHHEERSKLGIRARMILDRDTNDEVMANRNRYRLCQSRRMSTKLRTPAWFFMYKDTLTIFLQDNPDFLNTKALAIEIINKEISDTFKEIFEDYWARTEPFRRGNRMKQKRKKGQMAISE